MPLAFALIIQVTIRFRAAFGASSRLSHLTVGTSRARKALAYLTKLL